MKNGIQNKNQLTFSGLRKLLTQLDALQELYMSAMEQIQVCLKFIQSNTHFELNMAKLYSSNKPLDILEQIQQQNFDSNDENDQKNIKVEQNIKQIIFSLSKSKAIQQQIKQYISAISKLITKLKNKRECSMIITSFSLILKKRQKFQLKILQKSNYLEENLNDLSIITLQEKNQQEQLDIKRHCEFETLKQILNQKYESKPIQYKTKKTQESLNTQLVKEETVNEIKSCQFNQPYPAHHYYYQQYINYQMYQQYYYQQYKNETSLLNQQPMFYQSQPFFLNYYIQCQQNQKY